MVGLVKILDLRQSPEYKEALADAYRQEWAPYYGSGGAGNAQSDIAACLEGPGLPVCGIGLDKQGTLIGSVTIRRESLLGLDRFSPWLTGLLSLVENQGDIAALVAWAVKLARVEGAGKLYVADSEESIFSELGWQVVGQGSSLRGDLVILACDLEG